jgi:hypothetical protein
MMADSGFLSAWACGQLRMASSGWMPATIALDGDTMLGRLFANECARGPVSLEASGLVIAVLGVTDHPVDAETTGPGEL